MSSFLPNVYLRYRSVYFRIRGLSRPYVCLNLYFRYFHICRFLGRRLLHSQRTWNHCYQARIRRVSFELPERAEQPSPDPRPCNTSQDPQSPQTIWAGTRFQWQERMQVGWKRSWRTECQPGSAVLVLCVSRERVWSLRQFRGAVSEWVQPLRQSLFDCRMESCVQTVGLRASFWPKGQSWRLHDFTW